MNGQRLEIGRNLAVVLVSTMLVIAICITSVYGLQFTIQDHKLQEQRFQTCLASHGSVSDCSSAAKAH